MFPGVVKVLGVAVSGIETKHWKGWVEELKDDGVAKTLGDLRGKNKWISYIRGVQRLKKQRNAIVEYIQVSLLGQLCWAWVVRKDTGRGAWLWS